MGKISKHSFLMCFIWAVAYCIFVEDKSSVCALMAKLFAMFYLAERINEKRKE